jgi:hypothetical protein
MILLGSLGAGSITATGGSVSTITIDGISYKLHTFTSNDTFNISSGADNVSYLIVGAGGSGGSTCMSNSLYRGGSAGSISQGTLFKGEGSYSVTIGNGGSAVTSTSDDLPGPDFLDGNTGGSSSVFSISASGGVGGVVGSVGGNGAGANATTLVGGAGLDVSSFFGQSAGTTYLAGGGGAVSLQDVDGIHAAGGIGGGGRSGFPNAVSATANTGSGGGASGYFFTGNSVSGAGGSGVVYIKYQI